jgi:hypothetical protein
MPSQYDVPGSGAAPVGDPPRAGGPFSDEPGAATDPAASRHRSLVTVDHRLFLGSDAVTLATPEGFATVRFAEAADVLAHPDGGRILTGPGGTVIAVEPTLYAMLTPDRVAALDAALGAAAPDLAVRTRPREAASVPRPPEPGDSGPALSSRTRTPAPPRGRSRRRTVGLYVACLAVAGAALLAVRTTVGQIGSAHPHYTISAMFWVLTAGFVVVARDLRNPPKDRTHVPRWWDMQDYFKR